MSIYEQLWAHISELNASNLKSNLIHKNAKEKNYLYNWICPMIAHKWFSLTENLHNSQYAKDFSRISHWLLTMLQSLFKGMVELI